MEIEKIKSIKQIKQEKLEKLFPYISIDEVDVIVNELMDYLKIRQEVFNKEVKSNVISVRIADKDEDMSEVVEYK